jgi:hypothetical protein
MVSLSSASFNMDSIFESCQDNPDSSIEYIPILRTKDNKQQRVYFETHIFNCIRFDVEADKGFTDNLLNLMKDILNSDKVLDDNIKAVAGSIMKTCIDHNIKRYTDDEVRLIKRLHEEKKKAE